MNITRVGVDIAKSIFHVYAVDQHDNPIWQSKMTRSKWLGEICKRVPAGARIGIEACASAHHWGRELTTRGYHVKLIAAQFVKPYVKSNKNDRADAEAICEAMSRPRMRFVPLKAIPQQDNQASHRIREELVSQRTAKANQIRGLVGEYGLVAPAGIVQLRKALPCWLEASNNHISDAFRVLLSGLADDLVYLDARITELNKQIQEVVAQDEVATRLLQIRGVGPLIANALSAALGDAKTFSKGRDFAASLGLVPRQHSTGGKDRLLGISKRGDPYLRKLLVHGARSVIRHAKNKEDDLSRWVNRLRDRKHANVVTVALANKMARIAWALVNNGVHYEGALASRRQ